MTLFQSVAAQKDWDGQLGIVDSRGLNKTINYVGIQFSPSEEKSVEIEYSLNVAYCQRWVTETIDGITKGFYSRKNCKTVAANRNLLTCRKFAKIFHPNFLTPIFILAKFSFSLRNCSAFFVIQKSTFSLQLHKSV